jgi:hypothetical protein
MADITCKFCNDAGEIVIAPSTAWKAERTSITTSRTPLKSFCAHCELGRKKHSQWYLSYPKPNEQRLSPGAERVRLVASISKAAVETRPARPPGLG